jgi:tetratricopeptide (TPR) repeat protein
MTKEESAAGAGSNTARYEVSEETRKKAQRWFEQARKLVEQRNYDYAIKSFVEGLALDPEAVEEGYQPLRGCSIARWQTGGKKPGAMDRVKYPMTTKDPIKGLVNAAWLLAQDPTNAGYAEGLFRNASKAHCDRALMWVGPIFRECLSAEKKPDAKKFILMKEVYEELGDRCQARGENAEAVRAYELGLEAINTAAMLDSKNRELGNVIRDMSTKLTILRGNYQTADSFKESISNSEVQKQLHDQDRLVQSKDRLEELIAAAKADMDANPNVEAKVLHYVEMLTKDETDEHEKQAITVLLEKYKESGNYRYKVRADDIAIRQIGRHVRLARAAGNADRVKDLSRRKLAFEVNVFRERVAKYPTDLRQKYEYGRRLFQTRQLDEAIPLFQQARGEPKVRFASILHLGRCFFEKGFYAQAASILQEGIAEYELTEDDTAKELNYWLGRAYEADGKTEDARRVLGKLVQIDYNYRDVRDRLEGLK